MDIDVVHAIVNALALGAGSVAANAAVQEAYSKLREIIKERYPSLSIAQIEAAPSSRARRAVAEEDLITEGNPDDELLHAASDLVDAVQQYAPDAAPAIGLDVSEIVASKVRLKNVRGDSQGISVGRVHVGGDITIGGIIAHPDYKPPRRG